MIDAFSDSYLESVQVNEKDAFNFLCDAAEKKSEKVDIKKLSDELIYYLGLITEKIEKGTPLSGWKEEVADDLLTDWINTNKELQ